ncbi:hypothetical protein EJ02DRAFT_435494 [Clathrospora elynae]|uniref:Rhodopsin domain-containing protein n=1 Tax=Clathrospora elynae TaxID=706981 RepID=A0A6A5SU89_9PLEO|nr:hypothetical protein EJ02DRAFT_435494 [Clathrospora elynae]
MGLDQPISPAPAGYVVDLLNPQRNGEAANFWVGTLGMIVAALFMGIRLYTKAKLAKSITWDDGALVIAWCFSMAIQVPILFQYDRGTLGVHIWELTGNRAKSTMNLISMASILYCPFLASAKLSLLLFYLTLSHLRWFKLCVYASMFLVVGYNIALVFPLIFACTPFKRNWDITTTDGSCIDRTPLYMATAVLNMITDILLLVLPIPMIVKLQMPRAQKAGLICIFGVGSLTCITSGVRLALLFTMLKTIDQTWAIVLPGIWILIEANLVIITACLPTMRLFFRHVAPRLIGESTIRSRTGKQSTGYAGGTQNVQVELRTIGSKYTKTPCDRIDDDMVSVSSEERAPVGFQDAKVSERDSVPRRVLDRILKTQSIVIESEVVKDDGHSWR